MRPAPALAAAAFLALAPPALAAKVTLVVQDEKSRRAAAALAGPEVRVLAFDRAKLADPIAKGRFLAAAQAGGVVLSASRGRACGWLADELESVTLRCLAPFNGAQVLDYAREARWKRLAVLYSPGYERLLVRLRGAARARGVELAAAPVRRPSDLPQALPRALAGADALWLIDGSMASGASLESIIEQSLSHRVPFITAEPGMVPRGAFLDVELSDDAIVRHAVSIATAVARGADEGDSDPPPGRLLINQVLARRLGLRVPGGPR
jgi:hypothetical protein